jgi:hypothetical protein
VSSKHATHVRRSPLEWDWYCKQDSVVAKLLNMFVVGWGPSLLVVVWQGGILPLCLYLCTQVGYLCTQVGYLCTQEGLATGVMLDPQSLRSPCISS